MAKHNLEESEMRVMRVWGEMKHRIARNSKKGAPLIDALASWDLPKGTALAIAGSRGEPDYLLIDLRKASSMDCVEFCDNDDVERVSVYFKTKLAKRVKKRIKECNRDKRGHYEGVK